jgi:hypothetical protein
VVLHTQEAVEAVDTEMLVLVMVAMALREALLALMVWAEPMAQVE